MSLERYPLFADSVCVSYFTFDKSRFPDPAGMLRNISSKGRKAVGSVDPHLKRDPNYLHYKEARDQNLFIKDRNGAEYQGDCWPGNDVRVYGVNAAIRPIHCADGFRQRWPWRS